MMFDQINFNEPAVNARKRPRINVVEKLGNSPKLFEQYGEKCKKHESGRTKVRLLGWK